MALRQAEIERIDPKTKKVIFRDGREEDLPEDLAFDLFSSESAREKKERMKQAEKYVFGLTEKVGAGKVGAFASGFGDVNIFSNLATNWLADPIGSAFESISKGKGQEEKGFFERFSENLTAKRLGREEGRSEIQQKEPGAFGSGQVSGFAADFLSPLPKGIKGMSPIKQGATLGALFGASGSKKSIFEDPLEVAKASALGSGIGAGIGSISSRLSKVAQERSALRKFPELLEKHKAATSAAEKKFLAQMATKLEMISIDVKGQGIPKGVLAVEDFVNENIGLSPMAGTAEGTRLGKFFQTIEQAVPERMTTKDIQKIFESVEGRLTQATEIEAPIIQAFKTHLVERIPIGIAENAVSSKYGTRLLKTIDTEIDKSISALLSDKGVVDAITKHAGKEAVKDLGRSMKNFIKSGYEKLSPSEFIERLNDGSIENQIMWYVENNNKLVEIVNKIDGTLNQLQQVAPLAQLRSPEVQNLLKARDKISSMRDSISSVIQKNISNNQMSADIYFQDVLNKSSRKISNAVGVENPLITRRTTPTNLREVVPAPIEPEAGMAARFFETPNFYRTQGKRLLKTGSRGGLLGGYALGKLLPGIGAVAGKAGVAASSLGASLRGVTSPTALGEVARRGIQRGGIRYVIENIRETYPSYQNGILTDPQDRRSAAAQIEQDPDLGLEDKAVLQARINRGFNLETLLRSQRDGQ